MSGFKFSCITKGEDIMMLWDKVLYELQANNNTNITTRAIVLDKNYSNDLRN
jgi:hypothetical protein